MCTRPPREPPSCANRARPLATLCADSHNARWETLPWAWANRPISEPIGGAALIDTAVLITILLIPSASPLSFLARVRHSGRRAIAYRDLLRLPA